MFTADYSLDFSSQLTRTPDWSATNKHVIVWKQDIPHPKMHIKFKILQILVRTYGPLNRYELILLANFCPEIKVKITPTKLVSNYIGIAKPLGCISLHHPSTYARNNPPKGCGVWYDNIGGYCLYDEFGDKVTRDWRTADEAFHNWRDKYQYIPGWDCIPNQENLPQVTKY